MQARDFLEYHRYTILLNKRRAEILRSCCKLSRRRSWSTKSLRSYERLPHKTIRGDEARSPQIHDGRFLGAAKFRALTLPAKAVAGGLSSPVGRPVRRAGSVVV